MARGRARRHNPHIPKHIDQARLPAGLYWDHRWGGTWYILTRDPGGRQRRTNVADGRALLSDLHAIAEARSAKTNPKLLVGLCTAFEESPQFRRLAKTTRADYVYCRQVVVDQRTKLGRRFGDLETQKLTRPLIQRLVDKIAEGTERDAAGELIPTPSKAAHVQRYLSRLFKWGANRGFCEGNPAAMALVRADEHAVMQALAEYIVASSPPDDDSRLAVADAVARHLGLDWPSSQQPAAVDGDVAWIRLRGSQGEPAGTMTVTAELRDGSEVVLIRDNGNEIDHAVNLAAALATQHQEPKS